MIGVSYYTEYLTGADWMPDFETLREEVMTFLDESVEATAALTIPATLSGAAGTTADTLGLYWLVACGINDETLPLGARCYVAEVGGAPSILVRRVATP